MLTTRPSKQGIRAVALTPGSIQTKLGRYMTRETIAEMKAEMAKGNSAGTAQGAQGSYGWKTVEQGAATQIWAATIAPADEIGGRYCEDCQVAPITDDPATSGVRAYALDREKANALWALSCDMVEMLTGGVSSLPPENR